MKKVLYITAIISIFNFEFSICQAQSQQHFPDPLLQGYIAEALEHNSDLQTARLALEQSETMLRQARLSYLPNVSLAPSLNYSNNRENSPSTNRLTYELPLTMSWELNLGGKLHHQKEMAEAVLLKDSVLLRYVQIQLTADVANAYYTLVMLDRQRAVTQDGIRNQKESLRVLRALKEAGQQNETAVSQAEASYQAVVASLPTLEAQIRKTETALCLLLGRQPDSLARSPWEEVSPVDIDIQQMIPLEALSARPDVLAAEYQLRVAFSNVGVARAEFYPTLSINVSAGWTSDGVTVNPAQILFNAIASLTQPLFAQGRLKANLKVAQAQQQQAQIAFEKALLTAGGEVRDALADCQACQRREEARALQVAASRKAYENSCEQMRYAGATYLEVLVAQSTWLDAQLQQTADWLEKQQSLINLYKAICQ
jgi:NodT family efflux transporter outer membrane factor (OMF) lipoprotein